MPHTPKPTDPTPLPSPKALATDHPVAVVGGGLAGLTAAAELARGGQAVTVYESSPNLGGRAITRDLDGFRFNLGPRALYAGGPGKATLERLGVAVRGHVPRFIKPSAWVQRTVRPLPTGLWSLIACSFLGVQGRLEMARFLAGLSRHQPAERSHRSTDAWLRSSLRQPRSRQLGEALVRLTTYAADIRELPASIAVRQLQLAFGDSVLYLDGGWQSLVEGLRSIAVAAGARIVTDQRIRRVEEQAQGGVRCHLADGTSVTAPAAILAVGPDAVDRLLGADRATAYAETCQPVFAACLDVALDHLPRPEHTFLQGIDQPVYVSVHSATADLAPAGGALIHTLRYLQPDETLSRQQARDELEALLDALQPGWRDHLVHQQLLPRMRVCHDLPGVERRRAEPRVSDRVFVAGDWVGDAILADASITSGSQAGRMVLDAVSRRQSSADRRVA